MFYQYWIGAFVIPAVNALCGWSELQAALIELAISAGFPKSGDTEAGRGIRWESAIGILAQEGDS